MWDNDHSRACGYNLKQACDTTRTAKGKRRTARRTRLAPAADDRGMGGSAADNPRSPRRPRIHRRVGRQSQALIRLGFPAMNRLPPDKVHVYHAYAERVFNTPGVQATLKRDLAR